MEKGLEDVLIFKTLHNSVLKFICCCVNVSPWLRSRVNQQSSSHSLYMNDSLHFLEMRLLLACSMLLCYQNQVI